MLLSAGALHAVRQAENEYAEDYPDSGTFLAGRAGTGDRRGVSSAVYRQFVNPGLGGLLDWPA